MSAEGSFAPLVSVVDLSLGYGEREVLSRVGFELVEARTLAVMGPGGSGKTSLLRALAGAEVPGMWIEGDLRVAPRSLLVSWQKPVFGHESLGDLLRRAHGDAHQDLDELLASTWRTIPEAVEVLRPWLQAPLADADRDVRALVGWTQLRVRADLNPQALLLVDEPTADVSARVGGWIWQGLEQLRGNHTLVLVTHDQRLTRSVADEVMLLAGGRLVDVAAVDEFFNHPRSERVAQFVRLGS